MNFNLLSYALFFPAMAVIAVVVAQRCHTHGRVWMLRVFEGDATFVDAVNNVLRVGCYTINIGYIAIVMSNWEPITGPVEMLGVLSGRIALILLSLAYLHYQNIAVLLLWSRLKQRPQHQTPRMS